MSGRRSNKRDLEAAAPRPARARGLPSGLLRLARDRKGSAIVEFGLIAPAFIAALLFVMQVSVIYAATAVLQEATEIAARLVLTGQAKSSGMTQAQFTTALCANAAVFFQCGGLMVNMAPATSITSINNATPTLTYATNGSVSNAWSYNTGTPGQIMVLQVMYQWPVYAAQLMNMTTQSNGDVLMVATVVFKNEP